MAFLNWHLFISVVIVGAVKVVGTTFFLLYLPQIFPPVLERSLNSTNMERSTTGPPISSTTLKENFKYTTQENRRTGSPMSSTTLKENFKFTTKEIKRTDCPIRWDFNQGSCYFFSTNEENWENSQTRCQNEEATLAIINNSEEQKFLQNIADSEIYFIGLQYQRSLGIWQWTDGSEFMVNIPHGPLNADCGTIGLSPTLTSSPCQVSHRWICEKRAS